MMQQIFHMPYVSDPIVAKKLKEARSFFGTTLSKTKYSAKKIRGLKFDITIYDVMDLYIQQNGKCALTGWDLEFKRGGSWENATNSRAATIDRIYSNVGYVKWNIQLTCWMPNKIKSSLSDREFKQFCEDVIRHNR